MGQDLESLLTVINQGKVKLDILRQSLDNATIKEALRVEFSSFRLLGDPRFSAGRKRRAILNNLHN